MSNLIGNFEIALSVMLLAISVFILFSKNLISSIIMLGMFSLIMALIYLLLDAPDVAITEACVGACVSTLFLLAAFSKIKKTDDKIHISYVAIVLITLFAAMLIYIFWHLPLFGSFNAPINQHVAPDYIQQTGNVIGIHSLVAAILASYRGYDTLGETLVIFTAGIAVLAITKTKISHEK